MWFLAWSLEADDQDEADFKIIGEVITLFSSCHYRVLPILVRIHVERVGLNGLYNVVGFDRERT